MGEKFEQQEQPPQQDTGAVEKHVVSETQKELKDLKNQVHDISPEISSVVESITTKKDTYEADEKLFDEVKEYIQKKDFGKALKKALEAIGKLFGFKLKSGFEHVNNEESILGLANLVQASNNTKIEKYITDFEKQLSGNMSLSDKSDVTYLISKCKNALYDIKKKNEGKNITKTTKYEYFTNALTHNGTESPIGKVLLFNWGDFSYATEKKLFDKAIQSASGSGWEHVAIISSYNQETGEITLTHSTSKGVHTATLKDYLSFGSTNVDILALDIAKEKSQSVVDYVNQQKGKPYDMKGAVMDASSKKNTSTNDSFYCSELMYKGLENAGEQMSEQIIYPGQFLNVLKPSYVTSIHTSEVK